MTPGSPSTSVERAPGLMMPHGRFRVRVLQALVERQWFIHLRWLFASASTAILLMEASRAGASLRPRAIWYCILILVGANAVWSLLSHRIRSRLRADPASSSSRAAVVAFINAQMIVDLILLSAVIRYSGGVVNPLAVFYVFHMLLAALLLRPVNALAQGVIAMSLYGAVTVGECAGWLVPHHAFLPSTAGSMIHRDWGYVLSGLGALTVGLFGTLYFTLQVSSRLDEQESELRQAHRGMIESQQAIETLQARRLRFLQTAAHQLKSPITGVEMLAGLIRDRIVVGDAVFGVTDRIARRCREGITQVTELLTLARVEGAAPDRHHAARSSVSRVVRRAVARFADQARIKGVQLDGEIAERCDDLVAVDERDLEDCVANLLDNAIKYTAAGGCAGARVIANGADVCVEVTDSGMGIARGTEAELFEPYRRGEAALAAGIPGTGLGLAIVKEVMDQAGGAVDVVSEVGMGSRFTLRMPRVRGETGPLSARPDDTAAGLPRS